MKNKVVDKKIDKKIGMGIYFKRYKLPIFLYIFIYLIASAGDILTTIFFAQLIEKLTFELFTEAIYMCLIIMIIVVISRLGWYLTNRLYFKYTNKIMAELNYDLAKQSFKINSKTYSNNEIGTFVQRIVSDPERIVSNLSDLVITFMDMVSALVIIVYISTLNLYIALILICLIVICSFIEMRRVKLLKINRADYKKKNDKINS